MTDDAEKTQQQKDVEYEAHLRNLRAQEMARIHRIPVEEVLARWDNENAVRQSEAAAAVAASDGASLLAPTFEIESEMRGETIHYIEPSRRTSMMFFWTQGYEIVAGSITEWFHPADRRRTPVTPAEREQVVRRVVEWAKRAQGVTLKVVE